MSDETIGERVEKLESVAKNLALQLNGDIQLGITGRLGDIASSLATHATDVERLRRDIETSRRAALISAEDIETRLDYQRQQNAAKFEIIYRRVFILTILTVAFLIAEAIALVAVFMLALQAIAH